MISVTLPVRVVSEANSSWREHWAHKNRRRKAQHDAVKIGLYNHRAEIKGRETYTVTLTRIAPRNLDTDNLARSFKAVRDQIATEIGIDDGSARITWIYTQEKGKPKEYSMRVEINY